MYCLLWVEYSVRELHIMLFSISEFHKEWSSKGHAFLASVNETTFRHAPFISMTFLTHIMPF